MPSLLVDTLAHSAKSWARPWSLSREAEKPRECNCERRATTGAGTNETRPRIELRVVGGLTIQGWDLVAEEAKGWAQLGHKLPGTGRVPW